MSRDELLQRLGLRHRQNFTKSYLKPALEMGLIEFTVPDKPRSMNQKYRISNKGLEFLKTKTQ